MKKSFLKKGMSLLLTMGLLFTAAVPAVWADESSQGAAAPPASFEVYVNVDGSTEPTLLKTYTAADMRNMARESKDTYLADETYEKMTSNGTIYYTAASMYNLNCGRVVPEYILLSEFFKGLNIELSDDDYFIMGTDYTIDQKYSEYNFGSASENYNRYWKNYGWYDFDDIYGSRYYFQNWNEDTKFRVPSIIALKSYGGSDWTSETMWQMYGGSSDYLWAYVVNFGQNAMTEATYNRFYYQQTECTIKLAKDSAADSVITGLLSDMAQEAETELDTTVTGSQSSEVAEGSFWATEAQKTALRTALDANQNVKGTNGEVYSAYLKLKSAVKDFRTVKQEGTKTGYAWFSAADYDTTSSYVIRTKNQMVELAALVNGTADFGDLMAGAYDFSGKTITLASDIDLDRYRIVIGDETHPFRGVFDGNGHELSNLRVSKDTGYAALFGRNEGTIKNLSVSGSVTSSAGISEESGSAPVAGIAAYNSGTIENCRNHVSVSAENAANVGGIAGRNEGTITGCLNTAQITGFQDVGGIAGYNYTAAPAADTDGSAGEKYCPVVISSCLNAGRITALYESVGNKDNANAGGITGGIGADRDVWPVIDSCINSGDVITAGKTAGGIAGGAWIGEVTIRNCYHIGTVATEAQGADESGSETASGGSGSEDFAEDIDIADFYNIGAVAGRCKGTVSNCYWLENTADSGVGHAGSDSASDAKCVSAAQLISVNDLGDSFTVVENGFPVLSWQKVYQVGFDLSDKALVDTQSAGEYLKAYCPADPSVSGLSFGGWYTSSDYTQKYDFDRLITADTTIYAKLGNSSSGGSGGSSGGSGGGAAASSYQISVTPGSGGTASVSPEKAAAGETIAITVKPQAGYEIDTLTAVDRQGKIVSITESRDGYAFQMPSSDVTVNVSFRLANGTVGEEFPFTDTAFGAWYRPAVEYVWQNGLMNGVSSDLFAPNSDLTRGMIVQVLYNKEGKPSGTSVENSVAFDDVSGSAWYTAAVDWASAFGIVEGYGDGTFGPEDRITREQMAAIFCRYAQYKGADTSGRGDLSRFADANEISSWASDAVAWCVKNEILSGTSDGKMKPKDTATRGEAAQILMNFCGAVQMFKAEQSS